MGCDFIQPSQEGQKMRNEALTSFPSCKKLVMQLVAPSEPSSSPGKGSAVVRASAPAMDTQSARALFYLCGWEHCSVSVGKSTLLSLVHLAYSDSFTQSAGFQSARALSCSTTGMQARHEPIHFPFNTLSATGEISWHNSEIFSTDSVGCILIHFSSFVVCSRLESAGSIMIATAKPISNRRWLTSCHTQAAPCYCPMDD